VEWNLVLEMKLTPPFIPALSPLMAGFLFVEPFFSNEFSFFGLVDQGIGQTSLIGGRREKRFGNERRNE